MPKLINRRQQHTLPGLHKERRVSDIIPESLPKNVTSSTLMKSPEEQNLIKKQGEIPQKWRWSLLGGLAHELLM